MIKSLTLDVFFKQFKPILYRKRERIILPDEETNFAYYLEQGYVIQNILSPNGNEFTSHIFAPKTFFPLIWQNGKLSDGHCHEYVSLTPVEVYRSPKEKLVDFLLENPKANSVLIEQLMSYSASLLKKLESRIFNSAAQVVILGLIDLARLFGKRENQQIFIDYWFTHQDIANISGLSREVVTVQINALIRKKIIGYRHHFITIDNLKFLENELTKNK